MKQAGFARDSATWMTYGLVGFFAFMETVLGPIMPFLRRELDLGYAAAVRLAEEGFAMSQELAAEIITFWRLIRRFPSSFEVLTDDGRLALLDQVGAGGRPGERLHLQLHGAGTSPPPHL